MDDGAPVPRGELTHRRREGVVLSLAVIPGRWWDGIIEFVA